MPSTVLKQGFPADGGESAPWLPRALPIGLSRGLSRLRWSSRHVGSTRNHSDPGADPSTVPLSNSRQTRCDLHVHSHASSAPAVAALGWINCPECYSHPERIYEQARSRGMDLVAITDHDTIAGAMELVDRGYQGVIVGQEVTVYFPEDRCKLHVLVWGLTPDLDEQITRLNLRDDVYRFAGWLRDHNLPHSLAHPLYSQNGKLSKWHLDRCALLFKGFELLNGAHAGVHRTALERYLDSLTPSAMHRLIDEHRLEPLWPRTWEKAVTGGSDDHGLLNIGRTWTQVDSTDGTTITDPREFLRAVMNGRGSVGGVGGHSSLLAHQLTTVAAHYTARVIVPKAGPRARYAASKILRIAGVDSPEPSKAALIWDTLRRKITLGRRRRTLPIIDAFRETIGPTLDRHPTLKARLDPATWGSGSAISEHDDMASFADDLHAAVHQILASSAMRSLRERDKGGVVDHLMSYAILELTQVPYLFSLFHQNKDRVFVERLERESLARDSRGSGDAPERPDTASTGSTRMDDTVRSMRVLLFTDTYADVNGPSRFVQNIADQARATDRDLRVFTSTKLPHPPKPNVTNFDPVLAMKMPKYENLDLVLPPITKMLRAADKIQPDVIHISTPGPVGLVGLLAARMLRCPVVGVYHTDFPAYIQKLFDDPGLTQLSRKSMRWFYASFRAIFTRSDDYAKSLESLGMPKDRLVRLLPGIDLSSFKPDFRDDRVWRDLPKPALPHAEGANPVRVLYCGRVSLEKNLPMLVEVWKRTQDRLHAIGRDAELVIVGDGPYRQTMQDELRDHRVRFLGFRHGTELSKIYASSDLFVFPSITDTLGQVVMESQASGLPVLVTDIGGPKEVVQDGISGRVLRADAIDDWANSIVELVRDEELRRTMGRAAIESMRRKSIAASFDHYWSVHETVWREHRGEAESASSNGVIHAGDAEDARTTPDSHAATAASDATAAR